MKLHGPNRSKFVAHRGHVALVVSGQHAPYARQRTGVDYPGMVPSYGHLGRKTAVERVRTRPVYVSGDSVARSTGVLQGSAREFGKCLHAKAYA